MPNGDNAYVDITKLVDYCLSPHHPRGRHKARAFASAVELRSTDAEEVRQALLHAARTREAVELGNDDYGRRFRVDFSLTRAGGTAEIRSLWIIKNDEDFPRFVSCFVR